MRRSMLVTGLDTSEATMQSHRKLLLRSKEVRCIPPANAVQHRISRPWSNNKFFTPAYRKRERPGLPDTVTRSWHSLRGNYGQPAKARH
jgi:hypothetical protein